MHIELVETLRCPNPHEDTWLVAAVTRFDGRDIVDGVLGCPGCRAQYPVRAGVVDFTGATGTSERAVEGREDDEPLPTPDELLRARALLALGDAGGVVLLGGRLGRFGPVLEDQVQVAALLLNPTRTRPGERAFPSALRADDVLPVAAAALRGAWLDADTATPAMLAAAVRALRPGGRLVAPVTSPLPAGVRELARDAHEWVGEATAAASSPPIPLRRR
jgi:uncharacterized protein YbaR (Trm112 family)